jgi:hypothetical protein
LGGAAAVADEATAFSHHDARYLFHPISIWADPADDERMIPANRAFTTAMRPHRTGATYLNFTPEANRAQDAYGEATYARLVALKDTYDPANLFRLNQKHPSQPARCGACARLTPRSLVTNASPPGPCPGRRVIRTGRGST